METWLIVAFSVLVAFFILFMVLYYIFYSEWNAQKGEKKGKRPTILSVAKIEGFDTLSYSLVVISLIYALVTSSSVSKWLQRIVDTLENDDGKPATNKEKISIEGWIVFVLLILGVIGHISYFSITIFIKQKGYHEIYSIDDN